MRSATTLASRAHLVQRVVVLLRLTLTLVVPAVTGAAISTQGAHAASRQPAAALTTSAPAPLSPLPKNCPSSSGTHCTPPLVYHADKVQHHPRVYLVFWGPKWRPDDPIIAAMRQLFANLAGSQYNNILTQYYDNPNDPNAYVHNDTQLVDTWIDTSTPHSFTGSSYLLFQDLGQEVNQVVLPQNQSQNAQQLPPQTQPWTNSSDTQFLVFPQQGTSYDTASISGTFLQGDFFGLCGAHDVYTQPGVGSPSPYGPIIFAGIPYPTDLPDPTHPSNPACPGSVVDVMTYLASHEYAEMVTDPFGGLNGGTAWYTNESTQFEQQEIGDLCEWGGYQIPTYDTSGSVSPAGTLISLTMTYLWDNSNYAVTPQGSCVTARGQEYFKAVTGKHTVYDQFLTDYQDSLNGATASTCSPVLDCPVTERYLISNQYPNTAGWEQEFLNGRIYAASATAFAYAVQGSIFAEYAQAMNGPSGILGLPTSDQQPVYASDGTTLIGQRNTFVGTACGSSGGSAIYWSSATGAHEVHGCIYLRYWRDYGGPAGKSTYHLGFPTSDETSIAGGSVSYFAQNVCVSPGPNNSGSAVYFSSAGTFEVQGCIYYRYWNMGGPSSCLGFPTTDEGVTNGTSGDRISNFQHGSIVWQKATGQIVVSCPPPSGVTAPTGTVQCSVGHTTTLFSYCDAPLSPTIVCGGSIGSQNDLYGIPINWTYTNANANPACVTVRYSFSYNYGASNCSFYFYVPRGHATGVIVATLSDGTTQTVDENPIDGWYHWFDAVGITSLTFTDSNGQAVNQYMLGWGSNSAHSIERICSV